MRAVVQKVLKASVTVEQECLSNIGKGLLVLVGIKEDDTEKDMDYILNKLVGLRIFEDIEGKMNLSVKDVAGEILIVPNFTLYGNATKGMRPSFIASGRPEQAEIKYNQFIEKLSRMDVPFGTGKFQSYMKVELINDGPVTILLDSSKMF